ncbi:MAG TPA: hypothetical protein VK944_08860 [Candidatus Limnocylindria bacterium]|nr:hypothetical protein [Deltaproteobacteria bacterium]HSM00219.1 hypothetical protein [Candidatus Limnocylindria bacterium]
MSENDIIAGEVSDIVDGENIYVEHQHDRGNRNRMCAAKELVHINRIKLDDVVWLTGTYTRKLLETILWHRKVTCRIKSREKGGTIFADVYLS